MKYIEKYLSQRCDYTLDIPNEDFTPEIIVIIPAYNETIDSFKKVMASLVDQKLPNCSYAVMIIVNTHLKDNHTLRSESQLFYNELEAISNDISTSEVRMYPYIHDFSVKKSGVGHSRKMLMDLAFRWFRELHIEGVIVNLDADTLVADNYIASIHDHFNQHPRAEAASIRFEHTIPTDAHPIIDYELHLRYFINMQRLINLPFAYQTVGSAMAVRSNAYAKYGGMNKRQAGEDFYFLQKYAKALTLTNLNETMVIPSPRSSERVPFGTGKAVLAAQSDLYNANSYNYRSFTEIGKWTNETLKVLLNKNSESTALPIPSCNTLSQFLVNDGYEIYKLSLIENTDNQLVRYKSFFGWFNAFRLMKCLHYMRDHGYHDEPIDICSRYLFKRLNLPHSELRKDNLVTIREYDRNCDYKPTHL